MTLPPGELSSHDACCRALLEQLARMMVPAEMQHATGINALPMRLFNWSLEEGDYRTALTRLYQMVNT